MFQREKPRGWRAAYIWVFALYLCPVFALFQAYIHPERSTRNVGVAIISLFVAILYTFCVVLLKRIEKWTVTMADKFSEKRRSNK